MAKRPTLEDQLAAVSATRSDPHAPENVATLRKALGAKWNHLAAKAASIIGEATIHDVTPELIAAFDRFLGGEDKGCKAKRQIVEALYQLGSDAERVYLTAIRHVQMEPVYGGSVDVAAELRAVAGLGLVRMNQIDALLELAALLADGESVARAGAARAIAYRGGDDGAAVLRLKLAIGDDEPAVLTECLLAMLQLAPRQALALAERMLAEAGVARQEATALALGQSRLPEAMDLLQQWRKRTRDTDLRQIALIALAMLRLDASLALLIDLLASDEPDDAEGALRALAMYRHDPALTQRVSQALKASGKDPHRLAVFNELFEA